VASNNSNWPLPADAPAAEDLSRCVHCGLCVNSCPTYAVTGLETESPRGRIYLARGVDEGRIPLTAAVQSHWDLCLQCRACEAVCPSGVAYGRIIEHVKAQVAAAPQKDQKQRKLRRFVLRNVVARPRAVGIACLPLRIYGNLPGRGLIERAPLPGPLRRLRDAAAGAPKGQGRPFRPGAASPGAGKRAVIFTGCVMGEVFGNVHRATVRVLERAGYAADAETGQGCCGALHAHDGDLEFARELARRNIDALESPDDAPIVLNSAGCGAAMKEYGQLLSGDPNYAGRANRFAMRVKDLSEILAATPGRGEFPKPAKVAYQDACHLAHAQRIRNEPRALVGSITSLEAVETSGADMCCGAAGIYSIVQPGMSADLRARKAEQFRKHAPDIVVTANPGCHMQYVTAVKEAGIKARVLHLAELLDEAGWAPVMGPAGATPPS
jgi:glycolate oxidase iron-sulfur subunit